MSDRRARTHVRVTLPALALLLSASACSAAASSDTGEELTPLNFGVPTAMGANNSPMAVAEAMGYFAAEGLDVEIVVTGDSISSVQGVVSGQLDIGSTPPEPIMQAQLQDGPGGDLVMMYNYIRQQTGSLAVLESSDVESLEDLEGAIIGESDLGSSNLLLANGILASAGLEVDQDFTHLAVGTGAAALQALQAGEVDALSLWDTEYAAMEATGTPLRTFTTPEVESLFSTTYFSTPGYLEESADAAAGFGRAMAKATLFTSLNPEAALRMLYEEFPESRGAGQTVEEQIEVDLVALETRVKLLVAGDPAGNGTWGAYTPEAAEAWVEFAFGSGIIEEELDPATIYTNELTEQYNDFDAASVETDAAEWGEE